MRLTAAAAGITLLVLTGCTGGTATSTAPTGAPTVAPATITPTPDPSRQEQEASLNANPTPADCGVGDADVQLLDRDWQRVVDSVGLKRHLRYTEALQDRVAELAAAGADCPGGDALDALVTSAAALVDNATSGADPYDGLNAFRAAGNEWLEAIGRRPSLLG
jgi:hypothetical protein